MSNASSIGVRLYCTVGDEGLLWALQIREPAKNFLEARVSITTVAFASAFAFTCFLNYCASDVDVKEVLNGLDGMTYQTESATSSWNPTFRG